MNARAATPEEIARRKDNYFRATTRDRLVRQIRRVIPGFLWKRSHIIERQYRFQSEALEYPDKAYLQGFWQSPKYFADIADIIRVEFVPADESVTASANTFVSQLRAKHGSIVSLHVRRGDLAHAHEVLKDRQVVHGMPVGLDYIQQAIAKFPEGTCFLVFSDSAKDIQWCRENIRAPRLEFSTAESDLWDFVAMKLCDHHITANSTFSWWAAWLDEKPQGRVICPQRWSPPDAKFAMQTEDLLPAQWETI